MKVSIFQVLRKTRYISCIVLIFSLMVTMLLPLPVKAEGTEGSGFGVGNTPCYLAERSVQMVGNYIFMPS